MYVYSLSRAKLKCQEVISIKGNADSIYGCTVVRPTIGQIIRNYDSFLYRLAKFVPT